MQITANRQVLICHMDGGVPFVTSAVIVAQGSPEQARSINAFLDAVKNSMGNKLFCMEDEDVEVYGDKNTLASDYVSIEQFNLDLQMIKRVRASAEHEYSCICCSVEEFYRTYQHVPEHDFDFEVVPEDTAEENWAEAQQPFADNPVFVQVPVIEIDRSGCWHPAILHTDTIRMDGKTIIVNHSEASATVSGHRMYVVNVPRRPLSFNLEALRGFFTTCCLFRNMVLTK